MSRQGHALDRQLVRRTERVLRDSGIAPGGSLIIGVSGGADSLALVHILSRLRESLRLTLYVAHLDHGIRGKESEDDATFVQNTLRQWGIPVFLRRANMRQHLRPSENVVSEGQARQVRYRFFAQLADELKVDVVATGHTSDDQAETLLLHLVRGTGLTGLAGMQTLSTMAVEQLQVRLFRPFLEIPRSDTQAYCDFLNLYPRQDSTNLSLEPLRNRIRLHLLPTLEEYNPAIKDSLRRLARSAARQIAYLDQQAQEIWADAVQVESFGLTLDREVFGSLQTALQSHLIRLAYGQLRGGVPQELEQSHVEEMLYQMKGPSGRSSDLPGSIKFIVERSRGILTKEARMLDRNPPLNRSNALAIPGTTQLPGWTVSAELVVSPTEYPESLAYEAILDLNAVGRDLLVRGRLQGDRFQPLGMEQEKRLQDFLVDIHVPSHLRDQIPLLVSQQGIAWVVGHRIAHWARLKEDTNESVKLTFRPSK